MTTTTRERKHKLQLFVATLYGLTFLPVSPVFAAVTTFSGLLDVARGILDKIVPFIIGLAVFVIIWGIFNYITHAADEEKRADARQYIIYGVIGVFIMLSVWGLVNILLNTFNLDNSLGSDKIPHVPRINAGGGNVGDCDDAGDCNI